MVYFKYYKSAISRKILRKKVQHPNVIAFYSRKDFYPGSSMLYFTLSIVLVGLANAQLETPPSIADTFKSVYYVAEGKDNVVFQCTGTGNPKPRIYWEYEGQEFQPIDNQTVLYKNGTLQFLKIQNDWGQYQCFAENKLGKVMSNPFTLKQSKNLRFEELDDSEITGTVGEAAKISCKGQSTCVPKERCKFEWKIGEATDTPVKTNDRIAIDAEGTLHFSYLEKQDEDVSGLGFYACAIWNDDVRNLVKGPNMKLIVNVPLTGVKSRDPKLVFNSDTVTAFIGSKAEIQCIFQGKPVMRYIRWYKKTSGGRFDTGVLLDVNTPGSRYSTIDFGRKLVINYVTVADEGNYICKANNGDDKTKEATGSNNLNVISLPIFLNSDSKPKALTLQEGRDAVFRCNTRTLPGEIAHSTPIWYKDTEVISDSYKYNFNAERTKLVIKDVRKPVKYTSREMDVGVFQCAVQNNIGTVYGSGSLNVIEPITILQTLPETVLILPGEILSLPVDAKTDPQLNLTYTWSFTDLDNKTYSQRELMERYWRLTLEGKNMTIFAANETDTEIFDILGVYRVVIGHAYEKRELRTSVTTDMSLFPNQPHGLATAGFDYWILFIIFIIIFLLILILLILCCCCLCYRNRERSYPVEENEGKVGHYQDDRKKELVYNGLQELHRPNSRSGIDIYRDPDPDGYSQTDTKGSVQSMTLLYIESDDDEKDDTKFVFDSDDSLIGSYKERRELVQSTL